MALTFGGGETESQAVAQAQEQAQEQAPSGMLTGMTAQEVLDILPGPGSYYYNLYKAENPALVAEAEAIRNEARAAAKRGEAPSQPVGGGLTFGGGETTNVANPPLPPPPAVSEPDTQQQQLNQNFINFLEELGLGSLVTAFQSGTTPDLSGSGLMGNGSSSGGYTPYVPQMPTVAPVDFTLPVLPKNTVGYDPVRGLYNIPDATTQQTVTEQTGLFNYIYGPQG